MKYQNPMNVYVSKQQQALRNRVAQAERELQHEVAMLKSEHSMKNGGMTGNSGAKSLEHNLGRQLGHKFMPGNVGDINRVVWPFWFTTDKTTLVPNQAAQGNVTITQEAAFIWVSYQSAVFVEDVEDNDQYLYIDPDQPGGSGKANGLDVTFIDSQSQRQYSNLPVNINTLGHWKYPTVLPNPQLILPNSNLEWNFTNNSASSTYRPFITMFGYRVRIDQAKNVLSLLKA